MSDISDIFISYAREDRPRVQRLAEVLKNCGWSVWWDRDLVAGPRFRDVIEEQLKSARCVVVVWSTHATKRDWVLDEAQEAKEHGKLVAVRIDDVDLPLGFRGLETADLVGWEGDPAQPEFRRLVGGAESLIGRAPGHLPPPAGQLGKLSDLLQKVTFPAAKATASSIAVVVVVGIAVYAWYAVIDRGGPLKVAVMEFPEAPELSAADALILRSTRARLNSILSNIGAPELEVTSSELMDAKCEKLKQIPCAQELGIHKMISGEMSTSDSGVSLEVRVVDVARHFGRLERSFAHAESRKGLDKLQKQAAEDLLEWFHVKLTPEKTKLLANNFAKGTSQDYTDMLDTFPVAEEGKPTSLRPASPEISESVAWGIAIARAQEAPSSEEKARIIELLRQYQEALKAKSPERCAELQVEMTDPQRDKLQRYFDNAEGLSVEIKISDADIAVEGNEAVATFTRTDKFKEIPTGRDVQLEVRLSSLLTKQDGRWKIRGLKKPS